MNRGAIGIVAALFISLLSPAFSATPPKAGEKCTSINKKQIYKSYQYTCIKKSGKLVWSKGVLIKKVVTPIATPSPTLSPTLSPTPTPTVAPSPTESSSPSASPTPTPTPTITPSPKFTPRDWSALRNTDDGYINDYKSWCDVEFDLSGVLKEIETAYFQHTRCSGIYRVAKYELGKSRPLTQLDSNSEYSSIGQCKIAEPRNSMNTRGFFTNFEPDRLAYMNQTRIPGPKMSIQIIPLFASDTEKPKNSPESDYGAYLQFLTEWAKYSSDGENQINVNYPKEYLEFPNKVSSYNLFHENRHDSPDHLRFARDVVSAVDSKIDFKGIDTVIIVVPPGTPLNVFQQATIKNLQTNEGLIRVGTTEYPLTLKNLNSIKFSNFLVPFWWIHELYHSGIGLDDHYGDAKFDINTEYGLGGWTLMTPWGGDLSAWEKWFMGFINDNQIHCVSAQSATTRWIAPSSVKTKEKKLIVVPISQYKGIVIESIRAAGLYYKIPKSSEGVLVYEVDLAVVGHGKGLKLIPPTNRNPNQGKFFMGEATLRQSESVISNGFKITVVESGTFGDVVKVERA
jgi:hypothetical protein